MIAQILNFTVYECPRLVQILNFRVYECPRSSRGFRQTPRWHLILWSLPSSRPCLFRMCFWLFHIMPVHLLKPSSFTVCTFKQRATAVYGLWMAFCVNVRAGTALAIQLSAWTGRWHMEMGRDLRKASCCGECLSGDIAGCRQIYSFLYLQIPELLRPSEYL